VLARLGEAARVSRVVIFEIQHGSDGEVFLNWRHEWAAPGIEPRAGETLLQHLPLRAMGSSVGFASWARAARSTASYATCRPASDLVWRRRASGRPRCADLPRRSMVGIHRIRHCVSESAWGGEQIEALRLAARILGEAIQHERAAAARLRLEAQLQEAQRIESVGRLAGGVAHDFNNMLAVIMGYAEVGLDQVDASHPVHAGLIEIQKAAKHSADLTAQLLAFARKQVAAPKVLNLNDTIAATVTMLQRLIGEDNRARLAPKHDLVARQRRSRTDRPDSHQSLRQRQGRDLRCGPTHH